MPKNIKRKLVTNSLKRQVSIWEFEVNWYNKKLINTDDVTASFNNCVTVVFWEEPMKIYDEKWNMFEVTCKRAEKPLFNNPERVKMYWVKY